MKRLIPLATVLALLVLLGAFPMSFASHSRPFNGRFSGSFTSTSQTTASITGTGHMEHMGRTTLKASSTVTGSASCEGGFTATEQDTFTAANGDKVFILAHEIICPSSAHTFHLDGPWTITGGTGRFEHASGSGSVHVIAVETSMTSGTFTATTTGTITY